MRCAFRRCQVGGLALRTGKLAELAGLRFALLRGACQVDGLLCALGNLPSWLAFAALWGTCAVGWLAPRSGWVLQKISENTRGLLWLVPLAFVATRLSAIFSSPTRSPVACKLGWFAFEYRIPQARGVGFCSFVAWWPYSFALS